MLKIIKKTPIPIAGLMLALASGGVYLSAYGPIYKLIFGLLSLIIFALLTLKFFLYTSLVVENMNNPVIASVSPTFSMGTMILSTYVKPYNNLLATFMWILGLILHLSLILWFSRKFLANFDIKKVFPSYFIVYVGLVVASITGPAYSYIQLGQTVFWFGFIAYLILLPIVCYRLIKYPNMPAPTIPLTAILAAPASLCLAGYLSVFPVRNPHIILLLTGLSLVMYIGVILYLPRMIKLPFYPSYSAFTFPLVISGIGMKKVSSELINLGVSKSLIQGFIQIQEIIALVVIFYVLAQYIHKHFLQTNVPAKTQANN